MLAPGPQGLGWIPPVGSGACAHPQGCILGRVRAKQRPSQRWTPGGRRVGPPACWGGAGPAGLWVCERWETGDEGSPPREC